MRKALSILLLFIMVISCNQDNEQFNETNIIEKTKLEVYEKFANLEQPTEKDKKDFENLITTKYNNKSSGTVTECMFWCPDLGGYVTIQYHASTGAVWLGVTPELSEGGGTDWDLITPFGGGSDVARDFCCRLQGECAGAYDCS